MVIAAERRCVATSGYHCRVETIDADTAALLEIEHAGWQSLCNGTAAAFYGDVMTDDGVMVLANGQVMDRDQIVDALGSSPSWSSYEIAAPRTVVIGRDSRALVYTGTGHRQGADDFVGIMTSVYVREGDTWKLALYQQTAVA
jgi:hypothetical protein